MVIDREKAIEATATNLSKDCYLASHYALSSIWGVVFSIGYILYQYSQAQAGGSSGSDAVAPQQVTPA